MLETRAQRVIALPLLLGALVGLTLWFGTVPPNPELGYYPTADHLVVDYDTYVGEQVQVGGTVVETDPVVVFVEYASWDGHRYRMGSDRLRITGPVGAVQEGQAVQVYGTVQPGGTIHATEIVVVHVEDWLYMYVVSFLAGLWVLARLVKGWTVVPETFAVRRRSRPIRVVESIRARLRAGRATDA